MEKIKTGYKKTEMGAIPEDWEVKKLGEVCEILDSKRIPLSEEQREKMQGDIPYYGANGVLDYINDFIFDEDLILLAEDGGYFCDYKNRPIAYKISGKSWVNNHAHVLRVLSDYNFDLVFYALEHKDIRSYIQGGTREKLNQSELVKIPILIPPLPEQQKIAEILETIDNAIEKTDAIIAKYKRLKQGLMQDLLTKGIDENWQIRDEKTHKFKDSPLGRIPEEWKVVKLEEICEVTSSKRIFYDEYTDDGIPFYRSKEVIEKAQGKEPEKILCISKTKYEIIKSRFPIPKPGDILITAVGTLGIIYLVKETDKDFYFKDGNLVWLRSLNNNKIDGNFLIYIFSSIFDKQKEFLVIGTSQNALTIEKVKKMNILLPEMSEQIRITNILSNLNQAIEKEQAYKEKLERIKKGLMEDLLTGRVRVNSLL